MPSGRQSARRRGVAEDSDTEPEDGYTAEPSDAQKLETLKTIAMLDLGSGIRDFITSTDYHENRSRPNKRFIMDDRDCNKEGTEASERVERNRPATNKWNNFGNTDDAKKGVIEQLEDICGGQTHRQNVKAKLLAEAAAPGREPTLEDTYDERRRRAGIPPSRMSRGGSHAAANDRGNFLGGRGGGNAGSGPGRAAAPASSSYRPLDPAVDPNDDYGYKDKSRRSRAAKRSTTTMVNNTVRVTSSVTPAPTHPRAGKENKHPGRAVPLAPRAMSNAASSSPRPLPPRTQLPLTTLADSNSFMAAARGLFAFGKTQPRQTSASASTSAEPAASNRGLLASKFAPSSTTAAAKENVAPIQRAREEFRDPDLSPAELTDALPSTGQLSMTSPSVESDTIINDSQGGVGLGISLTGNGESSANQPDTSSRSPLQNNPDLMDIEIPEVKKEVLLPSAAATPSSEEMVAISKAELEKWNTIKALMQTGDTVGLMKHLSMQGSPKLTEVPTPTQPTQEPVQAQPIKVSFPSRSTAVSASTQPTDAQVPTQPNHSAARNIPSDKVEVANGYSVNATKVNAIIGDKKNWSKGVATQTTPSLAASKWAPGPRTSRVIPPKSTGSGVSSMPHPDGARPTSPITISSTSSSSYHSSVEHIMTQPVMQNTEPKSPMPRPFGQASASAAPATARPITAVNPFEVRDPNGIQDDVVLDYGGPAKLKPSVNGTATKTSKPTHTASVNKPAAEDLQHQRERIMADIKDQLGLSAGRGQKAKQPRVEKLGKDGAQTQGQKTELGARVLTAAPNRPMLKPKGPSSAAARAGLTGSKWATAEPASPVQFVPTTASLATTHPAPPVKPALVTPTVVPPKPNLPPKSALTTSRWAPAQSTAPFQPKSTTSGAIPATSTSTGKSALTSSKWATPQPTSSIKPATTLRDRSPNKSSRVERDYEVPTTNRTGPKGPPKRPNSPIFGDAKLVSKLPYTASSSSSIASTRYPPSKRSTAIKYTAPGAGYEGLLRDLAKVNLDSAAPTTGAKAAEAHHALAEAKTIAQQFGVHEDDSDESEL